ARLRPFARGRAFCTSLARRAADGPGRGRARHRSPRLRPLARRTARRDPLPPRRPPRTAPTPAGTTAGATVGAAIAAIALPGSQPGRGLVVAWSWPRAGLIAAIAAPTEEQGAESRSRRYGVIASKLSTRG